MWNHTFGEIFVSDAPRALGPQDLLEEQDHLTTKISLLLILGKGAMEMLIHLLFLAMNFCREQGF